MLKFFSRHTQKIETDITALTAYGVTPGVQQRLLKFFQDSDSRKLHHANPRFIAAQLQLNERETLQLLVAALKEGLVTLNWEVQCPACLNIDFTPKTLFDLRTYHNCPGCHQSHPTNADNQVRVTFSIDQRLRRLGEEANDLNFRAKIDAQYGVVSGHRLLTLQTFRDLFPRETIPPNESLIVQRVAILFTDLTGSTALYSRRGDSQAYSLVRQHFNILFQAVDGHNGVVVKTIGDAVMAAFTVASDALEAAIAMHQKLTDLNQQLQLPQEDWLMLKIGIDAGPCISVTLNERPDYFGTTVNTAARVQGTSQGNDIACTNDVLSEPAGLSIHRLSVGADRPRGGDELGEHARHRQRQTQRHQ